MSVKRYGIFLAYPPTSDLRHDGLGRYLASFLKGAEQREDVQFVLLCPSWAPDALRQLFRSEGVPAARFELIHPARKPLILRTYEAYQRRKSAKRVGVFKKFSSWIAARRRAWVSHIESLLVRADSVFTLLPALLEFGLIATLLLLLSPALLFAALVYAVGAGLKRFALANARFAHQTTARLGALLRDPKDDGLVLRLYKHMEQAETERMLRLLDRIRDVRAWYSPTAFWPAFNKIALPRLICVPDVVLTEFPAGFADVGGDRYLQTFEQIESVIRGGEYFVTYSNEVKWSTLVDRYAVPPQRVTTIRHAPSDLHQWVSVQGASDEGATERNYCKVLLRNALGKSTSAYSWGFLNTSLKFFFYASQFRPNKNLITLLTAYEHLLRSRYIGHKLILTGDAEQFAPVREFIEKHALQNDVLCLHGLPVRELAACYKLAELAINPSLSEGGCPFTFTEALSVGTPVLLARIAVTEEVLVDEQLRRATLFDPYDWRELADRIEWALEHRAELLRLQSKAYAELSQRTWGDVVAEHIETLDRIADDHAAGLRAGQPQLRSNAL